MIVRQRPTDRQTDRQAVQREMPNNMAGIKTDRTNTARALRVRRRREEAASRRDGNQVKERKIKDSDSEGEGVLAGSQEENDTNI